MKKQEKYKQETIDELKRYYQKTKQSILNSKNDVGVRNINQLVNKFDPSEDFEDFFKNWGPYIKQSVNKDKFGDEELKAAYFSLLTDSVTEKALKKLLNSLIKLIPCDKLKLNDSDCKLLKQRVTGFTDPYSYSRFSVIKNRNSRYRQSTY
jgi:hypothetical protein